MIRYFVAKDKETGKYIQLEEYVSLKLVEDPNEATLIDSKFSMKWNDESVIDDLTRNYLRKMTTIPYNNRVKEIEIIKVQVMVQPCD